MSIFVITSPIFNPVFAAFESNAICPTYIPCVDSTFSSIYGIMFLSYANIPSVASSNLSSFIYASIIGFVMFIGTAKPIPSADVIFTDVIPTTFPSKLMSGPPLFPGFIVASV